MAGPRLVCIVLAFALTACTQEPQKQEKPEAGTQHEETSVAGSESPVPQVIQDQLLTAEDVRDGARLLAEVIPTGKGPVRLLVSGDGPFSCGATGNCDRWIFRQTPSGYELEAELGSAQSFTFQKTGETDGFPDVQVQQHGSATSSELRLYRYDGARYSLTKCMDQDYQDPSDPERTLEKPIITEIPCPREQ